MARPKVTYIVSDIDKSLAFEWIANGLRDSIELSFILIGKNNTSLKLFLESIQVPAHYVADSEAGSYFSNFVKTILLLQRIRPDVVHTHLWRATTLGIPAAWLLAVPKRIFTRHHAMIHYREYPSGRKWDQLLNRLATTIVAISRNVKGILVNLDGAKPEKIRVIHHGFDLSYFERPEDARIERLRATYGLAAAGPVIGVIARYEEWKGISYCIAAFKSLRNDYPSAHLLLVNAAGSEAIRIKSELASLPNGSYTEIPFEKDLSALYALLNVYVHVPVDSQSEAFGQTYVEALAAGVPAIFTLSGVASEFISDGRNAVVVPFRDSDAIEKAIRKLIEDDALRRKLITAGKESLPPTFSLGRMIDELKKLYRAD